MTTNSTIDSKELNRWITFAIKHKYEYVISVCDNWDHNNYAVYCKDKKDFIFHYDNHDDINMQKINKIIQIIDGQAITWPVKF